MTIEVLVATMKKDLKTKLHKEMKITSKCTIINQTNENFEYIHKKDNVKVISLNERGLSRSRNLALSNASEDICVVADDDMYYEDNYKETIINSYKKYKDADIIAFVVENEDVNNRKKILKEGKVGFLKSMKLQSVQVTFKRKSIIDNNISFDDEFGTGSKYYWGEENIFLFDCLRKKLKIYYVPLKIATLNISESSWAKNYDSKHFEIQGKVYYRMSPLFYKILIIQFALRKRKLYIKIINSLNAFKSMLKGAKEYKKEKKNLKK